MKNLKKLMLLLIIASIWSIVNGQTNRKIIITQSIATVPEGKKWILESAARTRIQVTDGVLRRGSFCNAIFCSNPRMIGSISRGNIFKSESYALIFKDLEKVNYTNEHTFELTIISIVDKDFSPNDLHKKTAEEVGMNKIVFMAGETVFVGKCLESIEVKEMDMTHLDILEMKRKEEVANKALNLKLSNFQIPVTPDEYIEPETKPEIHDDNLRSIVFTSSGVLFKKPGEGFKVDNVSIWTIKLTPTNLSMKSSTGVTKSYSVIKMEFDKKMRSLKVILGETSNESTHYLLASWDNSSNEYSLVLKSFDESEEFQFQEVQSTEKQFQDSKTEKEISSNNQDEEKMVINNPDKGLSYLSDNQKGSGCSYSLDGRSALSLPKPYYPGNEEGIVVIKITVDKNGIVKNAEGVVRESTTSDTELINAAQKAAIKARFNASGNAPEIQSGKITYRFVLD